MDKFVAFIGPWFALLAIAGISAPDARAVAPPPRPLTLDEVLSGWAETSDSMRSMRCRFTRTQRSRNFGTRTATKGEVRLLRPDRLRVDQDTPQGRWTFLFTKNRIRVYNPADKSVWIMPKPADRTFLGEKTPRRSFGEGWRNFVSGVVFQEAYQQQMYWLYGGLPVRDLSRCFAPRLFKEDAWYVYLDLVPPESARHAFTRMRVVLEKSTFRVRQIWYEEAIGDEITLDFQKVEANPELTAEGFREGLPKDWKRVRIPRVLAGVETRSKD